MTPTPEMIMNWRDGNLHRIGPLSLRYTAALGGPAAGECFVETKEGIAFILDWMDAEAIALCIAPSADLWTAYESDSEEQSGGAKRGWLRLKLTSDPLKLRGVINWAGKPFQIARIVLDAGLGEKAVRPRGGRTTDYRREVLRKVSGSAKEDTRSDFVQCCAQFATDRDPKLDRAAWQGEALSRLRAADALAEEVAAMRKGLEEQDEWED